MAKFIFKNNSKTFEVTKKLTTLGTSTDADIPITSDEDLLCYLEKNPDGTCILEHIKGSRIKVNGKFTRRCHLKFGDLIELGNETAVFLDTEDERKSTYLSKYFKEIDPLLDIKEIKDEARLLLNNLMSETKAEKGMILLIEDGEPSILVGAEKDGTDFLTEFSETIIKTVLIDKKPILSNNVLHDSRFLPTQSIIALKIIATVVVPIIRNDIIYGVVYLWNSNTQSTFSNETLTIVKFYAWIFSILLENERLKFSVHTTIKTLKTNPKLKVWHDLISMNQEMVHIFEQCEKLANTSSNIVFYGEDGTGKKSLAKAIYEILANNTTMYMIKIKNKPENVVLDELSVYFNMQIPEGSNKKLLFIVDGIDALTEDLYSAMINLIDKYKDARWIFLMTRHPDDEAKPLDKRIRTRLGEIIIRLPSLRERREDIGPLVLKFLEEFCTMYSKEIKGFTQKAEKTLYNYNWDGNIEELKNVIKKAVLETNGDFVENDALEITSSTTFLTPLVKAKSEFMKRYIKAALEVTNGDKVKAAKLLKISYRTIYKYLEE